MRVLAGAIALALLVGVAQAQTPGFHLIMNDFGNTAGQAKAVSADGRVVVGRDGGSSAFIWSEAGGYYRLGSEPGTPASEGWGVSGDGSTMTGIAGSIAFRWRGPGTFQPLGNLPTYTTSVGIGANSDGSAIAGWSRGPSGSFRSQAWRWTESGGMQGLGFTAPGHFESEATGISADGNTVVGWSMDAGTGRTDAFAWTPSGGMRILSRPAGLPDVSVRAGGISRSGTFIVGACSETRSAQMWIGADIVDLGKPVGSSGTGAFRVSDDGQVVLGLTAYGLTEIRPSVWTSSTGFVPFTDYLASFGVTVPAGYTIRQVNDMSADGRTFCGYFSIGNGPAQAFVATVPGPGAAALGIVALAATARRRRLTENHLSPPHTPAPTAPATARCSATG